MADTPSLVDQIDALLPQTQCEQCGYAGCRPYAEAMAQGEAHNKCPPGGDRVQQQLATLLKRPSLPLDIPAGSVVGVRRLAVIREEDCIGCTKCIQACPVDAIAGAAKLMHTVISHECTGCELCVEPCPVDCIDMVLHPQHDQPIPDATREQFRQRFQARQQRLKNNAAQQALRRRKKQRQEQATATQAELSTLPESELTQLKADYQRSRAQHQQLRAAIDHMRRHGSTPAAIHLQRLDELGRHVSALKEQLTSAIETAKQSLAVAENSLTELKLAATRSELRWRQAVTSGVAATQLQQLEKQKDSDRQRLITAMQEAGLTTDDKSHN